MANRYAANTRVDVSATRADIESLLQRYGATAYLTGKMAPLLQLTGPTP